MRLVASLSGLPDDGLVIAIRRGGVRAAVAAMVIFGMLLPTLVWILPDRHVWPWDQGHYGEATLDLWITRGTGLWVSAMVHALSTKPPLLPWIGQVFVPLRHLTGDFESAMLLANVAFAGAAMTLVYVSTRRMGCSFSASMAGLMLLGGSGLSIALSHQYLVETAHIFSIALFIWAAWGTEQRSRTRCASLVILAVSAAMAAKTSSVTFALPLLAYIAIAIIFGRSRELPAASAIDRFLLLGAIGFCALTVVWYAVNWTSVRNHFIMSTVADTALIWGHQVNLRMKIPFWIENFSRGISSIPFLSAALFILIGASLAIAAQKSFRKPFAEWIENGTLFAFIVAGAVVLTIAAFCLQINEDTRFLAPLVPCVAVLTAWSLSAIRSKALFGAVLTALATSAASNHALSFGANPLRLTQYEYFSLADVDTADRSKLVQIVAKSCRPDTRGRWIVLGVNSENLNESSANFYKAKTDASPAAQRCRYTNLGIGSSLPHALALIDRLQVPYVVTQDPSRQPAPDAFNTAAKELAERLAHDDRFALVDRIDDILIYRRAVDTHKYTMEQVASRVAQREGGHVDIMTWFNDGLLLQGWAADVVAKNAARSVQIFLDQQNAGAFVPAYNRPDVSAALGVSTTIALGFVANVPAKSRAAVRVFAEMHDGSFVEIRYPVPTNR